MKSTGYQVAATFISAAFFVLTACSRQEAADTYEDCVLQNGTKAKTTDALHAVKLACKGKFPKTFDFDEIASQAEVKRWSVVAASSEYLAHSEADKSAAREQYFESVLRPRVPPDYVDEARSQFDAFSRRKEREVLPQRPANAPASQVPSTQ